MRTAGLMIFGTAGHSNDGWISERWFVEWWTRWADFHQMLPLLLLEITPYENNDITKSSWECRVDDDT